MLEPAEHSSFVMEHKPVAARAETNPLHGLITLPGSVPVEGALPIFAPHSSENLFHFVKK